MIIVNQNYGQLGNRLFLYAHILAYAAEHGRSVYYPGFTENSPFFPGLQKTGTIAIRRHLVGGGLPKLIQKSSFYFFRRFFYFNSKPLRFIEKLFGRKIHCRIDPLEEVFYPDYNPRQSLPKGICFFEGWAFRVHKTFQKHHEEIQQLFRFSSNLRTASRETLGKAQSQIKIGVHIRMGDYKKLAPQWVYPKEFWHSAMKKIQDECGGNVAFFLVSDDPDLRFNEEWIFRNRGAYQDDIALLSECDYVLGPPSTFNRWAAFVGGKPHFCTWDDKTLPALENFSPFKLCSKKALQMSDGELEAVRWFGIA